MWYFDLGPVAWQDMHSLVYALAQLGREGVVLARPEPPCLCVGNLVDIDQEVNGEFCRERGIAIFSRASRSRALCLAQDRLELQILVRDQRMRARRSENLQMALIPFLETCRALRLKAEYKAPNEIVVGGRQIASACITPVHASSAIAASLTLEFDAEVFTGALTTRDPNVRERLVEMVHARRTSLREQLGALPSEDLLKRKVRTSLQLVVGGLRPGVFDDALRAQIRDCGAAFSTAHHARRDARAEGWTVYVGAGAELQQRAYKAPGGFLRATCEWQDGRIVKALLSGDFFCYPPGGLFRLEAALVGVRGDQLAAKIDDFYRELGLVTPGIQPAHWAKVLTPAVQS